MRLYIYWDTAVREGDEGQCVSCKGDIWSVEVYWNGMYGDEYTDYDDDYACRKCNPKYIDHE